MSKSPHRRGLAASAVSFVLLTSTGASGDVSVGPLDRAAAVRTAIAAHPGIAAAEKRAHATALMAEAEGSLPPPEVMLQVWQVPLARPYAVGDAGMAMVGLGQTFPAPGSRGARERAGMHVASAERAMVADRTRSIRRDAEHAFADYVEATARHRIHVEHRAVAERTLALARARHAGGASLTDVMQAEVELARVEVDVVGDRSRIDGARARMNALMARSSSAPLGPPMSGEPEVASWDLATELVKAREVRPELRAASEQRQARTEEAKAAEKEAKLPSFSVAALYFAPVGPMPTHGYGANASLSLPWLWGEASSRREAGREAAQAAGDDARAAAIPVDAEVAMADTNMRAAALRLSALRDRALPASRRSFDAAWAGYEAARTDVLTLLASRRAVVDVESEIVAARAALDHALAELDAAVGTEVPRRALGPLDPAAFDGGADHGR
jgi:outer membrane protein, heavy metal efflux system